MKKVIFYLYYPLVLVVSKLPFRAIYIVSNVLYYIVYKLARYRLPVVKANLSSCFSELSDIERQEIEIRFYKYFCDHLVESFKSLSISKQAVTSRMAISGIEQVKEELSDGNSVIILLGHFGNWELANQAISLALPNQLNAVYMPFTDKHFNKLMLKVRTRFGGKATPQKSVYKEMRTQLGQPCATAFLADQTPPLGQGIQINFLNQKTPVFDGPEKIARKLNQQVYYLRIQRSARGNYHISLDLITKTPASTSEGQITRGYFKLLEDDIKQNPEYWLWSHRRWKHVLN